ncbi:MAG: 4Fe-4S double cluster binding domain-containing protein, partial [Phycisphaerae bacterium]
TLLIQPRLGSYMLLGGVMTTLKISDAAAKVEPDHCGTCTRCIDACPTQAITAYSVDARRCRGSWRMLGRVRNWWRWRGGCLNA